MALTAYQQQFRQRMKLAMRLRAEADRKARAYARLLAAALTDAATAADTMDLLNQTYRVDVSLRTIFVKSLADRVSAKLLVEVLAESQPGEEVVLFNQVPDANGGQLLPGNPVFGERLTDGVGKARSAEVVSETELKAALKPVAAVADEPGEG